jgi:amino acid transporter
MIWGAVSISSPTFQITQGKTVGLFAGLLIVHALLNSVATRHLAFATRGFVFVNLGTTAVIIIVLLATTPRSEMHSATYVFGTQGIINQTGGWNNGIAFLLGLLSVQWTMTDYDATAHISEEVRRAAYAAPAAIFIAVIGTGILGWLLNVVLMLCSGPIENLPGISQSAFLQIMALRMGTPVALFLWSFVCLTAFFVAQTALQACSRTVYAFSRDHGFPDNGYFGHIASSTRTPLRAIWFTAVLAIIPGFLDLASPIAANAIFALTAIALDLSYIIPIFLRRLYANHPDVNFRPGPFYMGPGLLGLAANVTCISWTLFVCVIFSLPTVFPVTKINMNYASVITVGVVFLSGVWYILSAHRHYHGPTSNLDSETKARLGLEDIQPDSSSTSEKEKDRVFMTLNSA